MNTLPSGERLRRASLAACRLPTLSRTSTLSRCLWPVHSRFAAVAARCKTGQAFEGSLLTVGGQAGSAFRLLATGMVGLRLLPLVPLAAAGLVGYHVLQQLAEPASSKTPEPPAAETVPVEEAASAAPVAPAAGRDNLSDVDD